MTPEAQRIAIAEACPSVFNVMGNHLYRLHDDGVRRLSNPLTDLNAMHEAEKVLTKDQLTGTRSEYGFLDNLVKICGEDSAYSATAAQRAEAFLRTLNLWTE